jgi:hypothetical protein
MRPILLARRIAQHLQRLALRHVRSARRRDAAVEGVHERPFQHDRKARRIGIAQRIGDEAPLRLVEDQGGPEAGLRKLGEEGAFLAGEEAAQDTHRGRFRQHYRFDCRRRVTFFAEIHRLDQRNLPRRDRIVARAQRGQRAGPVAWPANTGGEEAGMDATCVLRSVLRRQPEIVSRHTEIALQEPPINPPQPARERRLRVTIPHGIVEYRQRLRCAALRG